MRFLSCVAKMSVGDGAEVKSRRLRGAIFHGVLAKDAKAFPGGDNYATGEAYRSLTTQFVPGFSEGLVGMKVGGAVVFIPAAKGCNGSQAQGEIPANSDLIFAIKIVGYLHGTTAKNTTCSVLLMLGDAI